MGIQYHGVVAFFCGKYFRSTGRRIPMARASGSNDCNISFDWEKRFLGKAQVVCSDWIWPHVPVVCLCELWHERKFNLQSDRFANNHPFFIGAIASVIGIVLGYAFFTVEKNTPKSE